MLFNKNQVRKVNDKKVLHKVGKNWKVVSLALLMAIGGGAAATHVSNANADVSTNTANEIQSLEANDLVGHAQASEVATPTTKRNAKASLIPNTWYWKYNGGSAAKHNASKINDGILESSANDEVNGYVKSVAKNFPSQVKSLRNASKSASNKVSNEQSLASSYSAVAAKPNWSSEVSSLASNADETFSGYIESVSASASSFGAGVSEGSKAVSEMSIVNSYAQLISSINSDDSTNSGTKNYYSDLALSASVRYDIASTAAADANSLNDNIVNISGNNSSNLNNDKNLMYNLSAAETIAKLNSAEDAGTVRSLASQFGYSANDSSVTSSEVSAYARDFVPVRGNLQDSEYNYDFTTVNNDDSNVDVQVQSSSGKIWTDDASPAGVTNDVDVYQLMSDTNIIELYDSAYNDYYNDVNARAKNNKVFSASVSSAESLVQSADNVLSSAKSTSAIDSVLGNGAPLLGELLPVVPKLSEAVKGLGTDYTFDRDSFNTSFGPNPDQADQDNAVADYLGAFDDNDIDDVTKGKLPALQRAAKAFVTHYNNDNADHLATVDPDKVSIASDAADNSAEAHILDLYGDIASSDNYKDNNNRAVNAGHINLMTESEAVSAAQSGINLGTMFNGTLNGSGANSLWDAATHKESINANKVSSVVATALGTTTAKVSTSEVNDVESLVDDFANQSLDFTGGTTYADPNTLAGGYGILPSAFSSAGSALRSIAGATPNNASSIASAITDFNPEEIAGYDKPGKSGAEASALANVYSAYGAVDGTSYVDLNGTDTTPGRTASNVISSVKSAVSEAASYSVGDITNENPSAEARYYSSVYDEMTTSYSNESSASNSYSAATDEGIALANIFANSYSDDANSDHASMVATSNDFENFMLEHVNDPSAYSDAASSASVEASAYSNDSALASAFAQNVYLHYPKFIRTLKGVPMHTGTEFNVKNLDHKIGRVPAGLRLAVKGVGFDSHGALRYIVNYGGKRAYVSGNNNLVTQAYLPADNNIELVTKRPIREYSNNGNLTKITLPTGTIVEGSIVRQDNFNNGFTKIQLENGNWITANTEYVAKQTTSVSASTSAGTAVSNGSITPNHSNTARTDLYSQQHFYNDPQLHD